MPTAKRCGTCELLVRSSTFGLTTWGKCPHRTGWVRTQHDACEHHAAGERGPKRKLVRAIITLQIGVALAGYGTFVVMDLRNGNLYSHIVVALVAAIILAFGAFVWKYDLLSEEPKYGLLDESDPPPEEEHGRWHDR